MQENNCKTNKEYKIKRIINEKKFINEIWKNL